MQEEKELLESLRYYADLNYHPFPLFQYFGSDDAHWPRSTVCCMMFYRLKNKKEGGSNAVGKIFFCLVC